MRKRKVDTVKAGENVVDYRHKTVTRLNIPPAGLERRGGRSPGRSGFSMPIIRIWRRRCGLMAPAGLMILPNLLRRREIGSWSRRRSNACRRPFVIISYAWGGRGEIWFYFFLSNTGQLMIAFSNIKRV